MHLFLKRKNKEINDKKMSIINAIIKFLSSNNKTLLLYYVKFICESI